LAKAALSDRSLVVLLAAIQFVNVLDFMMVMPLGPDFAESLNIETSRLGWIGGSYTAAAAAAGLLSAGWLDRFDRRRALLVALLGLSVGTAAGGLANSLETLIAARALAGAFGGPATSLCYAIVADRIPPASRGRAIGTVMGAFSLAAVLGVPAGLELARFGGWRLPFFAVAGACLAITGVAAASLPSLGGHRRQSELEPSRTWEVFLRDASVRTAFAATAVAMCGGFLIIPNISAYFQYNLGYPREHLGLLYLCGGLVTFIAMRFGGRWVDRFGAPRVALFASILMAGDLLAGFFPARPLVPVMVVFVAFMLSSAFRAIAVSSLASRVPLASERARFMSAQAAVQHGASATGAFLSSVLLAELPNGALAGMHRVALVAFTLTLTIPLLVSRLSGIVRRDEELRAPWVPVPSALEGCYSDRPPPPSRKANR
jgi:predicted MFS family arabinose efflux permease